MAHRVSKIIAGLFLCTALLTVFPFAVQADPTVEGEGMMMQTAQEDKNRGGGCQPEETKRVPVPDIYKGLEGVVLLISSSFFEEDAPYADVLKKEKIRDVFRESIVKNVLPFVRTSGVDCTVQPAFYEFYSTDFKRPERWAEIDKITNNPNVITIHIQVSRLLMDRNKDRPVAAFIFNIHRAGFKSGLHTVGLSVLDLQASPEEISEFLLHFKDSKYFLTDRP